MGSEFKITRQVEFADTDMAGIMHFSKFFHFMEFAEHAFYRSLKSSVHTTLRGTTFGWPRVRATCEYLSPLYFEDEVEIHLLVREIRKRSISYTFIFRKVVEENIKEVARGELTVVCATRQPGKKDYKSVPIPREILKKIQPATPQLFPHKKK
mgnify:CR=1 FL=1